MPEDLLLRETADGIALGLRVSPGSSRDRILGTHAGALKLAVSAAPEKGRANRAVIALLSRALGVRQRDVQVVSGIASRDKTALVRGLSSAALRERLSGFL